jgi:hypothetical protein
MQTASTRLLVLDHRRERAIIITDAGAEPENCRWRLYTPAYAPSILAA